MKIRSSMMGVTVAALVMAACSSGPREYAQLEAARSAVQRVQSLPDAGKYAASEVDKANQALREADELAEDRGSRRSIDEAAYVAKRHADTAMELIARGKAEERTAEAEAERQRVLLQAREQEAAAARAKAEAARMQALTAQQQSEQARLQAQEQAEAARREKAMLEEQLRDLQARQTERGLVLTLGDVLFDTGQATLKPGAASTIERLAVFLGQAPDRSVIIEGHTDSMGTDSYNMMLSENRANSVKSAVVAKGVDPARVVTVGKGEGAPVAGNDTAAGRQQNRRVEIIISNPAQNSPVVSGR